MEEEVTDGGGRQPVTARGDKQLAVGCWRELRQSHQGC